MKKFLTSTVLIMGLAFLTACSPDNSNSNKKKTSEISKPSTSQKTSSSKPKKIDPYPNLSEEQAYKKIITDTQQHVNSEMPAILSKLSTDIKNANAQFKTDQDSSKLMSSLTDAQSTALTTLANITGTTITGNTVNVGFQLPDNGALQQMRKVNQIKAKTINGGQTDVSIFGRYSEQLDTLEQQYEQQIKDTYQQSSTS